MPPLTPVKVMVRRTGKDTAEAVVAVGVWSATLDPPEDDPRLLINTLLTPETACAAERTVLSLIVMLKSKASHVNRLRTAVSMADFTAS